MRICFIADASSIHVQRIVSHFLGKKDDVLILSSAAYRSDIAGAKVVHLLSTKTLLDGSSDGRKHKKSLAIFFKSFFSPSLKYFIRFTLSSLTLVRKRTRCIKEIERFNPEVIYCFRSFPEGILASRCHVRPLLLRTAGPDICKFPRYPIYKQMIRKALRTADLVLTESFWERKMLQQFCGGEVVPEVNLIGVDTTLFRRSFSPDSVRAKYGLPQDSFVVVSNRYLDGHYNGWLVLKAMESILDKCPNLFILYVNPSRMDSRSKAKAATITKRFPQIKILDGPLAHSVIPEILCCGDAYISFSAFDGVPYSLLEAMACGLVPVVADLPQLHEWIEDGTTGYFVRQYDTEHLASVVGYLYKHRRGLSDMATRCVSKVRAQASYEVCAERARDLLKQLTCRAVA